MNSAERASARTSATTSGNAPQKQRDDAAAAEVGEATFLQQQANLAKEAISSTFDQFAVHLKQGISPGEWTRQYPWISVGAAAVAGFVAAARLVPSKEQQALKKLAALERALHPMPVAVPADGVTAERVKASGKGGILGGLVGELLKHAQPIIMSALTAKVAATETQESQEKTAAETAQAVASATTATASRPMPEPPYMRPPPASAPPPSDAQTL